MKTKIKENLTLFIPVTNLTAMWKGDFKSLPARRTYELVIDYPLEHPARFSIKTGKGMTLFALLKRIGAAYESIYETDDNDRANDNEDYRYGVWGHDIGDLSLEGINIDHKKRRITIDVGS